MRTAAAHRRRSIEEARLPDRVRRRALAVFGGAGRGRGPPPPPARPSRSTSTRSAGSTPSSTWSAPARPSRCSGRRGRALRRSPPAPAWSAPPTACCPTRRRRWSSCWPACGAPTVGLDVAVELTTPTGAALLAALASAFGPLPADDHRAQRLRRRHPRARRPAQRSPRSCSATADRRARPPASRWCCSRPTSTTPPARCWPTPSPPCSTPAPTTPGSRRSS